ncbi:hypothetical protein FLA_5373 [Filimonas lacunae]|nr:hypothetical protein FLA_5373 [Filimonas lacunae]
MEELGFQTPADVFEALFSLYDIDEAILMLENLYGRSLMACERDKVVEEKPAQVYFFSKHMKAVLEGLYILHKKPESAQVTMPVLRAC